MDPLNDWVLKCNAQRKSFAAYPKSFGETFKSASYFRPCKNEVDGMLKWGSWGHWSSTCGSADRVKIARSCEPDFAVCKDIQVQKSSRYSSCPSQENAKFRYYNKGREFGNSRRGKTGKVKFDYRDFAVGEISQDYDGDFELPLGYWFLHTNWATSGTGNTGHARIYKNGIELCRS